MHVRVAWEIYHHQQKQQSDAKSGVGVKSELLRPPSHLFPSGLVPPPPRPHDLPFPPSLAHRPPAAFEPQSLPGSQFTAPATHIAGAGISPFSRYGTAFSATNSPFGLSPFQPSRELPPMGPMHDPWSRVQRSFPYPTPSVPAPWGLKPDPVAIERREQEERERERERERLRREREERERREREEKQRKLEQQQQQERERREKERRELERREMEKERERERERLLHQQRLAESSKQANLARERSPMRNGTTDLDVRVKEEPRPKEEDPLSRQPDPRYHPYLGRHPATLPPPSVLDRTRSMLPPSLPTHFAPPPPSHWPPPDPYGYRYEPLRFNPLVEAAMRAEEERVKMYSAYSSHPGQLRKEGPSLLHMRPGPGPVPPPTHKLCATPPGAELLKKDDSSQSR